MYVEHIRKENFWLGVSSLQEAPPTAKWSYELSTSGSSRGVVTNVLDLDIVVSSNFYIHNRTNTLITPP